VTNSAPTTHARFRNCIIIAAGLAAGTGWMLASRLLAAEEESEYPDLTNFEFVLSFKYEHGSYYYFASCDETIRIWYPRWLVPTFRQT